MALAFIFAATMFYQASRLLAMDAEKKVTESQEAGLSVACFQPCHYTENRRIK